MGGEQTDDTLGDFQRRPKKGKRNRVKDRSDLMPQQIVPVLGPLAVNGTKPMIGSHSGRDAIFALAANYPIELFKFFVGSVRRFGFKDDIVLAVNPQKSMQKNTFEYLVETNVVAYGFEVDCRKKDDCKLRDDFFGSVPRRLSLLSLSQLSRSSPLPPLCQYSLRALWLRCFLTLSSPSPSRLQSIGSSSMTPGPTFSSSTSETPSSKQTLSFPLALTPRVSPNMSCMYLLSTTE
jgi:hypothetical protein